ncbi:hypothetical protein CHS0354_034213, partial [Potamilus streckersoni]
MHIIVRSYTSKSSTTQVSATPQGRSEPAEHCYIQLMRSLSVESMPEHPFHYRNFFLIPSSEPESLLPSRRVLWGLGRAGTRISTTCVTSLIK